jgi:hypothetical protein
MGELDRSPELTLCNGQPLSAMQRTSGDRCKKTGQSQLHLSEQYQNRVDYGLRIKWFIPAN